MTNTDTAVIECVLCEARDATEERMLCRQCLVAQLLQDLGGKIASADLCNVTEDTLELWQTTLDQLARFLFGEFDAAHLMLIMEIVGL